MDAMERAGLAPLTTKTHWGVINAFFGWLTVEGVLAVSPIAKASTSVNPAFDRVRDIVAPDFRFIDMLSARLGDGRIGWSSSCCWARAAAARRWPAWWSATWIWLPSGCGFVSQWSGGRPPRLQQDSQRWSRSRAAVVGPQLVELLREHLMLMDAHEADTPLPTSVSGQSFQWSDYLARRLRPMISSTAVRWAVGERKRLIARG